MQEELKPITEGEKGKWDYFRQMIEGMEVVLEFVLDELEGEAWENEDDEDMDEEESMDKVDKVDKVNGNGSGRGLSQLIDNFLKENMSIFPKLLSLSSTVVPGT